MRKSKSYTPDYTQLVELNEHSFLLYHKRGVELAYKMFKDIVIEELKEFQTMVLQTEKIA